MNSFFCNSVWTHKQALFWYLWLWGSALFSGSSPNELCFIYNCALTHQMSSVFCRRPQFLWWVLVAGTVGRVSYNPQCCRCVFLVDLHTSVKKKKFFLQKYMSSASPKLAWTVSVRGSCSDVGGSHNWLTT